MKKILSVALLVLALCITSVCAAEVPDLLGNWTGLGSGRYVENGFSKSLENWSINLTIEEQKDRLFSGNLSYKNENETQIVEGFAGAIGPDNKTLYLTEYNEGYDIGTIISANEIELIYLQDGKKGEVEIDRLHRIEA